MFNGGAILPFDFVLPNELLVTIGTEAMDWLFGDAVDVAFDWLLRDSIERKLLRLVAERLDVTINVFEAELAPWVARTVAIPTGDGTVKVIGKQSLRGCCHCSRSSGTAVKFYSYNRVRGKSSTYNIYRCTVISPKGGNKVLSKTIA